MDDPTSEADLHTLLNPGTIHKRFFLFPTHLPDPTDVSTSSGLGSKEGRPYVLCLFTVLQVVPFTEGRGFVPSE